MEKRIDELDGVRALAVAAVFVHHGFKVKLLWAGVDLFFILSGFLITGILMEGSRNRSLGAYFSHFYGRRVRRLLPPYLLLLLVASLIFGVAWARHWYLYVFLMNVLVGFSIDTPASLKVLWSLAVEEQFYLVWPFIVYFARDKAIARTAAVLLIAAPILRFLFTPAFHEHWQIYSLTPFRMDLLAMGALLAVVWRTRPDLLRRSGPYGLALSVLALAVIGALSRNPHFNTDANTRLVNVWLYELTMLVSTGIILWALSGWKTAPLTWRPVRCLGRISYTVYLIHMTALVVAGRFLHNHAAAALVAGLASLAYAAASWRWIERPILFWKPASRVRREAREDVAAISFSNRESSTRS